MKRLLSIFAMLLMVVCMAQAQDPVTWTMTSRMTGKTTGVVTITAKISPKWHLYDMKKSANTPVAPTEFTFNTPAGLKWNAPVKAARKATVEYDEMWEAKVAFWMKSISFTRSFTLTGTKPVKVTAKVSYQACNDENCTRDTKELSTTVSRKK